MTTPDPQHLPTGQADRMPTAAEERTAERLAREVDADEVAEHYEEMAELGADVKGEGEILPGTDSDCDDDDHMDR